MSIPKVIHQIWVGGSMPERYAAYRATWARHHPDWEHRFWSDDDLGWIPHRDLYDRADELVPGDAVGQFRADIARYAILAKHGGFYADVDTEALRPVDAALVGHDAFAAAEDDRWVGNTYLAAAPNHPVTFDLVDRLAASVQRHRGWRPNRMTGPHYLTPIWRRRRCHVAPRHLWFPYSYRDVYNDRVPGDYGNAYAVHHWGHARDLVAARR